MKGILAVGLIAGAIGLFALSQRSKPIGPAPIDSRIDTNQSNPVMIPEQKTDVLNADSMNETNYNIQTSKPITGNLAQVNLLPMRLTR